VLEIIRHDYKINGSNDNHNFSRRAYYTCRSITNDNKYFCTIRGAQEESEGDLTVVINGETFTTGQTITISGSVDGSIASGPFIYIYDPEGNQIAFDSPNLSADDTFTFSLVAGDNDDPGLLAEEPMDTSGNYRVEASISPTFGSRDEVNMEFEYIVTAEPEEPEPSPQPQATTPDTTSSPTTIARILNVTALRDMVIQGQQQTQELNNALIRANASDTILSELNTIQNTFQNMRGNLTGVSPQTQVIE
jgi:hypothetical protein